MNGEIRPGVKVFLDAKKPVEPSREPAGPLSTQLKRNREQEDIGKGGIDGVDVGYSKLKDQVEKSLLLLADGKTSRCVICAEDVGDQRQTILVCSLATCRAVFHMTCLAQSFLVKEQEENIVLPTSGNCPQCKSELQWVDLVTEMTLRVRGEAEVASLTKKPKVPKSKAVKGEKDLLPDVAAEPTSDVADEDHNHGSKDGDSETSTVLEEPLPDDWHFQEDDDDDRMSIASVTSYASPWLDTSNHTDSIGGPRLEIVIEDSDWDDVEVLD